MSIANQQKITCRKCGWEQTFTTWQSLNVSLDEQRKQELIDGSLTRFTCENCGQIANVVYPLLYHDMKKQLMIWLVPEGTPPDTGELLAAKGMQDYRFRLVSTRNDLVEKIMLFDADLDDRAIEFFKLLLAVQSTDGDHPLTGTLLFAALSETPDGRKSITFDHLEGTKSESVTLPFEAFENVSASIAPKLAAMPIEKEKWVRIDHTFAAQLARS